MSLEDSTIEDDTIEDDLNLFYNLTSQLAAKYRGLLVTFKNVWTVL